MERRHARAATLLSGALFVFVVTLVACGGGTNGPGMSPSMPAPNNQVPELPSNQISVQLAQSGMVALPSISGISSTMALSANSAPTGAKLTVGVSVAPPAAAASIPVSNASAFEYFTLTASSNVTFKGFPGMALQLPSVPKNEGKLYAWIYDTSAKTWTDLGTVNISGSRISFGGGSATITLRANIAYVVASFTASVGASCPTPPPPPNCPPATPAPGPTPTGTRLYVAVVCFNPNAETTIEAFDENENQIGLSGTFPNVSGVTGMAFDSLNQRLYVVNGSNATITAYDKDGHQIATPGNFPNLFFPFGIAFDPSNRHLYVTNGGERPITVYDEDGNQIMPSGAFSVPANLGITFDTANKELYAIGGSVAVYDENGNTVSTTGTFPNLSLPAGIAFDSSNQRLYVTNDGTTHIPSVTAYDAEGNQVSVTGNFAGLSIPGSIAFDPTSHHIYVVNAGFQNLNVYDEEGNLLTTIQFGEPGAIVVAQ